MIYRLLRSPEGAESAGPAVVEATTPAAAENATPEANEAPPADAKVEKPKATDWDIYLKLKEKDGKPNAKFTKAEAAIAKKYLGKEEHQIEGYRKAQKGTPEVEEESAPAKAEPEPEEAPEVDPLEPVLKAVGAKDKTQLEEKVKGLVKEVQRLSGSNGEVGRLLKETGLPDLKTLRKELDSAARLDRLVKDLKKGDANAFAFIGVKGQLPAQEKYNGEIPEGVLDDGLYRHVSPLLKAANDRAERLERELAAIKGKLEPWEKSNAETQAQAQRNAQLNTIVTEATALFDGVEGIWDSKKSGSLSKALTEFYSTPDGMNPALSTVMEIISLAQERNLPDLETALALWERKNGGSLIAKARAEAREPFVGKAPNVGLSDRQGNHNGQFKSFTESTVKEMVAGKRPIPSEWKDAQGTLVKGRVPQHLHHIIFEE